MVTKRIIAVTVLFALFAVPLIAQNADKAEKELTTNEKKSILREFTHTANMDGINYTFILLNDKSVDALFVGDSKISMRTRANMSTCFFVSGKATRDLTAYKPTFSVEQEGKSIAGEAINIQNFAPGTVSRGAKVQGLIQLAEKIDLTKPFRIRGPQNASTDMKLSKKALEYLEN